MEKQKNYAKELLKDVNHLLITDDTHVFGITRRGNVKDEFLKENYGEISFSFDILDKIRKVIEGLHFGDRLGDVDIRFLAPKTDMPLVIIARFPQTHSRSAHEDHPSDFVILLAPRKESGSLVYPSIDKEYEE